MSDSGSAARSAADAVHRASVGSARLTGRAFRAYRALPYERRLAAIAAVLLFFTLFLPWYQETVIATGATAKSHLRTGSASLSGWGAFSFVEAAVLLVAVGVLTLLFQRAEGRAFHLPGGDGGVVMLAGGWTCCLVVWRIFDKQGTSTANQYATTYGIEWGIFVALAVAAFLAYAGSRIRAAHTPEPPLPGDGVLPDPEPAPRRARRSRPEASSGDGSGFHIPTAAPAGEATGAYGADADDPADDQETQIVSGGRDRQPPPVPAAANRTRPRGRRLPGQQAAGDRSASDERAAAPSAGLGRSRRRSESQGPAGPTPAAQPPARRASQGPANTPPVGPPPVGPPPLRVPRPGEPGSGRRRASERRTGWLTARPQTPDEFPDDPTEDVLSGDGGDLPGSPGTKPPTPRTMRSPLGWSYDDEADTRTDAPGSGAGDDSGDWEEDGRAGPDDVWEEIRVERRDGWTVSDFDYDRRVRAPRGKLEHDPDPDDDGPDLEDPSRGRRAPQAEDRPSDRRAPQPEDRPSDRRPPQAADGRDVGPADDVDYYDDQPLASRPQLPERRPSRSRLPDSGSSRSSEHSPDPPPRSTDPPPRRTDPPPRGTDPPRRPALYDIDASEDETIVGRSPRSQPDDNASEDETIVERTRRAQAYDTDADVNVDVDVDVDVDQTLIDPLRRRPRQN